MAYTASEADCKTPEIQRLLERLYGVDKDVPYLHDFPAEALEAE